MTVLYRGNCLPMTNSNEAISQQEYSLFKNTWVRRECYLHTLYLNGELPVLDSNDLIFVPDDFTPSLENLRFYRKSFSKSFKRWRKRTVQADKIDRDSSLDKGASRKKFTKQIGEFYERLSDPVKANRLPPNPDKAMNNLQKLECQLIDSTFMFRYTLHVIVPSENKEGTSNRDSLKIENRNRVEAHDIRMIKRREFEKESKIKSKSV